jgi:hypothetical protein
LLNAERAHHACDRLPLSDGTAYTGPFVFILIFEKGAARSAA